MTIKLEPHSEMWSIFFKKECMNLQHVLKSNIVEIHHIGSTAIPAVHAVPVLDIMCVVHTLDGVSQFSSNFEAKGYTLTKLDDREILLERIAKDGHTKLSSISIFEKSDSRIGDFIDFRDYLNSEDSVASEFQKMKENHVENEEKYQKAKEAFISIVLSSL